MVGLAVLIVTVGSVVLLVLPIVLIYPHDVLPVCLKANLLPCERYVPLKHCWIDGGERCTVWFLLVGRWYDLLELDVLSVADKLYPDIIIVVRTSVMVAGGFATPSAQIVFAICM